MSRSQRLQSVGRIALAALIIGSVAAAPGLVVAPAMAASKVAAANSSTTTRPTLRVSTTQAQVGERLWLTVTGVPVRATIRVQKREIARTGTAQPAYAPVGKWTAATDDYTTARTTVRLHVRVAGPAQYRLVVDGAQGTARKSLPVTVPTFGIAKTLAVRVDESSAKLGDVDTDVRVLTKKQARKISGAKKKVRAVSWQAFDEGVAVQVTRGKRTRTWLVLGEIGEAYREAGGPTGDWGVPRGDAKCGLLRAGCVQTFSARTAYSSTRTKKAITTTALGRFGEVDVALRSWLGFKVTYANNKTTPIQRWMGSSSAWCGYFQTWGFHASGNADLLPPKQKLIPFNNMRETARKVMKTSKKPKVGALAFVRTERGRDAGHVGLITAVSKTHIRLLHGNTGGGGLVPRGYRGVVETWLPRSTAAFYAYPEY